MDKECQECFICCENDCVTTIDVDKFIISLDYGQLAEVAYENGFVSFANEDDSDEYRDEIVRFIKKCYKDSKIPVCGDC